MMFKKLLVVAVIGGFLFTLSGCGSSTDTDTSVLDDQAVVDSNVVNNEDLFAVQACNDYVELMDCIISKNSPEVAVQQQASLDTLIDVWTSLAPEQLQKTCDETMTAVYAQREKVEELGCTVK